VRAKKIKMTGFPGNLGREYFQENEEEILRKKEGL